MRTTITVVNETWDMDTIVILISTDSCRHAIQTFIQEMAIADTISFYILSF